MFVSQFVADAPLPQPRPTHDSFGLGQTEEKEPAHRFQAVKDAFRSLWSMPDQHPVTPELRSYPR